MKIKKLTSLIIVCVMIISLFSACGNSSIIWEVDKDNHWTLDANGSIIKLDSHNWVEHKKGYEGEFICSVCNAFKGDNCVIMWYNDRMIEFVLDADGNLVESVLTMYDEDLNVSSETIYNADGTIKHEYTYVYEFSEENGGIDITKIYEGDRLVEEIVSEYYDENGELVPAKRIIYNEDGTQTVTDYYILEDE